jgi:hypothetical protein
MPAGGVMVGYDVRKRVKVGVGAGWSQAAGKRAVLSRST